MNLLLVLLVCCILVCFVIQVLLPRDNFKLPPSDKDTERQYRARRQAEDARLERLGRSNAIKILKRGGAINVHTEGGHVSKIYFWGHRYHTDYGTRDDAKEALDLVEEYLITTRYEEIRNIMSRY